MPGRSSTSSAFPLLAAWPVFVIGDDPGRLSFTVQLGAAVRDLDEIPLQAIVEPGSDERRRYVTRELQVRRARSGNGSFVPTGPSAPSAV